jgi:hypothetical protein
MFEGASSYVGENKRGGRGQPLVYAANSTKDYGKTKDISKIRCFKCHELGHYASDCEYDKSAQEVKQPNLAFNAQSKEDSEEEDDMYGFPSLLTAFAAKVTKIDPRMIYVDSLASECFGCNLDLVTDIRDTCIDIHGVGGITKVTKVGMLPCFGRMLITPNAGLNAIPLSKLERYDVVYDKNVAIRCTIDDICLVFKYIDDFEAYGCIFTDDILDRLSKAEMPASIYPSRNEHIAKYPKRERIKAITARELSRRLWWPSDTSLARYLNNGGIINTDIMGRDVALAQSILGPDEAVLKGKSVNRGPPTTFEPVYIHPSERREQTVYIDVFDYRGKSFILMKLKPLQLIMTEHIDGRQVTDNFVRIISKMIGKIHEYGFTVDKIVVDPDRALNGLIGKLNVIVEVKGARAHVVDAEREIRIVKERLRCNENSQPFKVARRLVPSEVTAATIAINCIPRSDSVLSPREIFRRKKLNYATDIRIAWGEYVQVEVMPSHIQKSGPTPRTVAAIALFPVGNNEGSYMFYDINTERQFIGTKWTVLNVPEMAIEKLNKLFHRDEIKTRELTEEQELDTTVVVPKRRAEPLPYTLYDSIPGEQYLSEETEPPTDDQLGHDQETLIDNQLDYDQAPEEDDILGEIPNNHEQELGYKIDEGIRKSIRISQRQLEKRVYLATKMSLKKAMTDPDPGAKEAVRAEMTQMIQKNVFKIVNKSELTSAQVKSTIRSSMFVTKKYDAEGKFLKWKARLVAGGDGQEKELYEDVSSPTVSQESVMMMLGIAATENESIATADVTGAYLECELDANDIVIMKLDKHLAKILIDLMDQGDYNHLDKIVDDGQLYVQLRRALYGCVQSSSLWFKKLTTVLTKVGFTVNNYDPCVYSQMVSGSRVTIAIHVDDLLITSKSETNLKYVCDVLKRNFAEVTTTRGASHSYLAMKINVDDNYIHINMIGYIDKILENCDLKEGVKSPAAENLFEVDNTSPLLNEISTKRFHTNVAKLLYLAKRCRMDILTAVSYLSSRVKAPTKDDDNKLERVLSYLHHSREKQISLKRLNKVTLTFYVDASFGSHDDGRSRTGIVAIMAGAAIATWSSKQKMVTKSSTEAEIVALSDSLTHVLWMRAFINDLGYTLEPTVIYQDNKSVLSIMRSGRRSHQRTKHLNVRYFFVIEKQSNGEVTLLYCPTDLMYADLFTKPIAGAKFKNLSDKLFGEFFITGCVEKC